MLQRRLGLGVIEHLLERGVDPLGLPDLLHRASVVAGVGRRGHLGTEDERLHRREVRKPLIALDVPEDEVEQPERRARGEEVLHVGVPRPIEARHEREPGVVVEQHEPRLVDGGDRQSVVPRPVPGSVLEIVERSPQRLALTGLDVEGQAEVTGRTGREPWTGRTRCSRCHRPSASSPTSIVPRFQPAACAGLRHHPLRVTSPVPPWPRPWVSGREELRSSARRISWAWRPNSGLMLPYQALDLGPLRDITTQQTLWSHRGFYATAPVIANGVVYVGRSDGFVVAID